MDQDRQRYWIGLDLGGTKIFPRETVAECTPFRITRNADLAVEGDLFADLLAEMEDVLSERKKSDCVRLEVDEKTSQTTLLFLRKVLHVGERDTYRATGPLNLAAFMKIGSIEGYEKLKYEPWSPQPLPTLDVSENIFKVLDRRDILLCHPFDAFDPVLRMVQEAAKDPDVLAVKQILYRTSRNSPIIAALKQAAEEGKNVTVIVELKARFDEARNIEWAHELEEAGVQVIYGVKGLKTHAKLCIVVRRESRGIQRYIHFGSRKLQ